MKLEMARGVRDFPPEEKILRQDIVDIIRNTFERYGYNPLETPLIERFETLSAKFAAGESSDAIKEIFRFKDQGERDLGLRFELTLSFARFIGMNPQLKMPFKRYEIGRVFRDGPIKLGRYREFWQCDVDVVGSDDMSADAEMLSIVVDVFKELDLDIVIEINNRKILNGILEFADVPKLKSEQTMIVIDKLKKIGKDNVKKELKELKLNDDSIKKILSLISIEGTNDQILNSLRKKLDNDIFKEGFEEMSQLLKYLKEFNVKVKFLPSLARGLAYYRGHVYEVYLKNSKITGSVVGGGRWDNMIGNFLGKGKYPATGLSFGLEPITEALKIKNKELRKSITQVYIIPIKTRKECIKIAQELRKMNIKTDMPLSDKGLSKCLDYANSFGIPYVIIIGEDELKKNKVKLKDMKSGKEELLSVNEVIKKLN